MSSNLADLIRLNLLEGEDGVIRRLRLRRGLCLAFAGTSYSGLLTVSRKRPFEIDEKELYVLLRELERAVDESKLGWQGCRELSREVVGGYNVIRFSLYFGRQVSMFESEV